MTPEEEQVLITQAAQGAQAWAMVQLMAAYNPDLIAGPGRLHFGNKAMRLDQLGIQIQSWGTARGALYFVGQNDFMLTPPEGDDLVAGLWGFHYAPSLQNQLTMRAGNPPGGGGKHYSQLDLFQLNKQVTATLGISHDDPDNTATFIANSTSSGSVVSARIEAKEAAGPTAWVSALAGTANAPSVFIRADGGNDSSIVVTGSNDTVPASISLSTQGASISISGAPLALPTNAGAFSTLTTDGMVQYDTAADKALLRANGVTETLATEDYVDTAIAAIPEPSSGGGYATHFLLMGA